jgi:hypothetical protein
VKKSKVIGQTGRVVLSDDITRVKRSKRSTVRYGFVKMQQGFRCEVIGPFFSRCYGECSFGPKRVLALAALKRRLANERGYLGHLMFSDVDDADNVGLSPAELSVRLNSIQRKMLENVRQG